MSIKVYSIKQISSLLKKAGYLVFQNKALSNTAYPYLVYSFVSERRKSASNSVYQHLYDYQLSLFTAGAESELSKLTQVLDDNGVLYERFSQTQGDDNDDTITNFYTYLEVIPNE